MNEENPDNGSMADSLPSILTVKDVSGHWRVSPKWVYRHIQYGGLPCIRLGAHIRIPRDKFIAYLELFGRKVK